MSAPIILCDTAGMTNERWLECRAHGPKGTIPYTVGGSDVAAIFGVSPWTTPLELWMIKKGRMKAPVKPNQEQLMMGHLLEPIAAYWYQQKTGNTVYDDTYMYQHADHPWALADFDRRFTRKEDNAPGILECKSCTYHKAGDWADDAYPIYYELQLRFYLAVADVEIGAFSTIWGNNPEHDLAMPALTRDRAKEDMIFQRLEEQTMDIVRNHPYRLCEMVGVGFKTADRIAISMGFDPLSPERVDEGLIFTLTDAELKRHLCMEKHSFLKQCLKLLDTEGLTEEMLAVRASRMLESGRLASYDRQVYRAVTARTEQSLAWAVYRMLTYEKAESHVNIDTEISAEEKKQGIQLASEQRHAVTTALTSQLSVITGGPGTGKTLIQRFLLDIYRRKNRGAKIICCAPTGRAARRMEQSTGFPATTIHKALGLLAGEDGDYCEPEMLDADLIVVDEVSMMDIYLANHLFRSVPHGSQLVLIGDADQLPSVGPGAVLSEIIACGAVPVVRLDRIFRQSYGSRIAANAKLIRHGNLSLEYGEDFQFYDSCDMSTSAQQIETLYLQETAKYGVDNVALLTPYRQKTETGVNALNERLREKLNPQDGEKPEVVYRKRIYRLRDKVMQIKNCEDISNGDIGYITSITRDDTDSVLTVDFGDGRIAEYDGSDLEMLDLAYASTIHKSQGSEYKSVIINLQCAHAVMLVRPLVYTAITRAKERVLIVGERRALCIAIKRTDTEQRGTMLSARIKELISNVKGDHYNGNLAQ